MNLFAFLSDPKATVLLPEAGGEAAHSIYLLLGGELPPSRTIALDDNPAALIFWRDKGFQTSSLRGFTPEAGHYGALPCYENPLHPRISRLYSDTVLTQRYKADDLKTVATECHYMKAPRQPIMQLIARPQTGSGGKGVQHLYTPDVVLTERIQGLEYVVDYNTNLGIILPRVTHNIRYGRDTYCHLIGNRHPDYGPIVSCTAEAVRHLNCTGIGNLQMIRGKHGFYFVEIAPRVSGSAWLNLRAGNSPFSNTNNMDFYRLAVHTLPSNQQDIVNENTA